MVLPSTYLLSFKYLWVLRYHGVSILQDKMPITFLQMKVVHVNVLTKLQTDLLLSISVIQVVRQQQILTNGLGLIFLMLSPSTFSEKRTQPLKPLEQ